MPAAGGNAGLVLEDDLGGNQVSNKGLVALEGRRRKAQGEALRTLGTYEARLSKQIFKVRKLAFPGFAKPHPGLYGDALPGLAFITSASLSKVVYSASYVASHAVSCDRLPDFP